MKKKGWALPRPARGRNPGPRNLRTRVQGGALAFLLLASCSAPPPPPPPKLALTIHAGASQNPDPSGHPEPVAVRVYQLTGTGKFERADIFSLLDHQETALGPEMLGEEEVLISPGETRTLTREVKPGTQFVGVAVLFRDADHAKWRAVAPAAAHGTTALTVGTTGLVASLSRGKAS